jgi:hypothetical protein
MTRSVSSINSPHVILHVLPARLVPFEVRPFRRRACVGFVAKLAVIAVVAPGARQ